MPTSQGFRGLRVYQLAFKLAMNSLDSEPPIAPDEASTIKNLIPQRVKIFL